VNFGPFQLPLRHTLDHKIIGDHEILTFEVVVVVLLLLFLLFDVFGPTSANLLI
jgi:hypothetical protein